MTKIETLRIIAENYARIVLGPTKTSRRLVADAYFILVAREMYPTNEKRQEWAIKNMQVFYQKESERREIMEKLSGQKPSLDEKITEVKRQQRLRSHNQ